MSEARDLDSREERSGESRGETAVLRAIPPNAPVQLYWDQLHDSPLNPRRHADPERLRELMASIEKRGVEHALVVRRSRIKLTDYEVVSGSRRLAAVQALVGERRCAPDLTLPCLIRELSDAEVIERALAENLQREDLTPFEEADSFAQRLEYAAEPITVEGLADRLNRPVRFIKQRLVLHYRLAAAARRAYEKGEISLAQAQALTIGEKAEQERLLAQVVAHPGGFRAADIRRMLLGTAIPMSRAEFDAARYQGAFKPDLFEDEQYATDWDEFRRLQREWCEGKRAELAAIWSWVELKIGGGWAPWEYDRDQPPVGPDGRRAGAVIHLREDLRVEIHTGLAKRAAPVLSSFGGSPVEELPVPAAGSSAVRGSAATPPQSGELSRAHMVWARHEKSRRLQLAVAQNPPAAVSLAILGLLGGSDEVHIEPVESYAADDQIANPALTRLRDARLKRLPGKTAKGAAAARFRALMRLPGDERGALLAALVAPLFASWCGYSPDLGDSELVIAVAEETGADVVDEPFAMTAPYLELMPAAQLRRVALACGVSEIDAGMPKTELVDAILLSPDRDPAWYPPELEFAPKAQILAAIAPPAAAEAAE
jgi:ParB/RepB/Spo0J family partition protein